MTAQFIDYFPNQLKMFSCSISRNVIVQKKTFTTLCGNSEKKLHRNADKK